LVTVASDICRHDISSNAPALLPPIIGCRRSPAVADHRLFSELQNEIGDTEENQHGASHHQQERSGAERMFVKNFIGIHFLVSLSAADGRLNFQLSTCNS
jgi:hypothetical protein